MGDFMVNQSSDDSVITYLRQQKLMLLELALLMTSTWVLAMKYQLSMAVLLSVIVLLALW